MRIVKNGDVHVSAPIGIPKSVVERFIEEHRDWITEARKKTYESQKRRAEFYNQLPLRTREQADDALRRLKALVEPMVERHSREMGVKPSKVYYKAMISRWGVCNVKSICFSTYLLLLPEWCVEHVVVHELCHLLEPSHNARFHALMDKYFPRWREARKAARERVKNGVSMKKILFLHGFFASGQCIPALALREALADKVQVLTPDLPQHPKEALELIRSICDKEHPDLLVGNSCGSFYAQMLAPIVGVPALLGNPHFRMTEFLQQRIGEHEYKSPRSDGNQQFVIDEALIKEFAEMEAIQFNCCNPSYKDKVWGLFGEKDTLAHFEPMFLEHYNKTFHFPGGHTPTADEVRTWYIPLIEKMLMG